MPWEHNLAILAATMNMQMIQIFLLKRLRPVDCSQELNGLIDLQTLSRTDSQTDLLCRYKPSVNTEKTF